MRTNFFSHKRVGLCFVLLSIGQQLWADDPAAITNYEVIYNGSVTQNRNFSVGDTVTLRITATDPSSRPIEYIFRRYRRNSYQSTLNEWSSQNQIDYTFQAQDVIAGFSIIAGAKNNDGDDADGFFGDFQWGENFKITN